MEKLKVLMIAIISTLMNFLGILAIPIFLLAGCNLLDYFTGLCAAKYRTEEINSYKGMKGIIKKVCMWLLVLIGAMVDILIDYTVTNVGISINLPLIMATVVAVWLVVNEIISILENIVDIGVELPPFLLPIAKNIKRQVETKTNVEDKR